MLKTSLKILLILVLVLNMKNLYAEEKLAQTGFQFLSVVPDARAAALTGAMTTVNQNSSGLWGNPATMAGLTTRFDVALSQNNWIADINHSSISCSYAPANGQFGVFGISALFVDYGEVEGTIFAPNEQGFLETGIIEPTAYLIGLGYAKKLSDKFAVGGQIKTVHQDLGPALSRLSSETNTVKTEENKLSTMAFDFGTIYRTGFKSFVFGMSVRNFSEEIKYVDESFQLPLTFSIGASIDIFDFFKEQTEGQKLLFTADAVHPRSHSEQVKIGFEYSFKRILDIRIGYVSDADEQNFSYGFGLSPFGMSLDYAYTPFGVFDKVQRFTLRFTI